MNEDRTTAIKIVLVDDHPLLLDGLAGILNQTTGFTVVGRYNSGEEALGKLAEAKPDIVILDINMPNMNGIELAGKLKGGFPDLRIMALSSYLEIGLIQQMLEAGASGYMLKSANADQLVKGIHTIAGGEMFFSEEVSAEMAKKLGTKPTKEIRLTPREHDVLRLIAQEHPNKQIAKKLFISERTVETHRKSIFRKTETASIVGLIKLAIQKGWIDAD